MFKISRLIAGFLITIALTAYATAEDVGRMRLPVLKDVQVKFQLVFDTRSGLYEYIYTVSNPSTNTGEIWDIRVDISRPPDSIELSSEGFLIPLGATTESFDESMAGFEDLPGGYVHMVPVGIKPPSGWAGDIMARGAASFSIDKDRGGKLILPGDTLADLKLISYGPPAIREITVDPWWMYVQSADMTDEEAEEEDKRAREIEASVPFKTKTLGPTAPPADFKPIAFIDYIISLKHEAVTLGWIKNEGIVTSLDVKLENAKKAIEKNNIRPAKNMLEAFINEVEAQGCATYDKCVEGKHLTPEGYGLLKYNAEYLLGKL